MKVSVVIPTHNDEGTIAQTLESVFAQQVEGGFEVIVVNDGSTDGTRAVVEKFDARTRVIDQKNRGVAAARNVGISAAAGEYIALLDADDTWTGQILQKTVALLDKNPNASRYSRTGWKWTARAGSSTRTTSSPVVTIRRRSMRCSAAGRGRSWSVRS